MTQEQILEILDSYKLRIPPTVYYDLLADVVEAEDEQESKTGHWIDSSNGWMCSECNRDNTYDTNYCPNCGAKMD